MLNKSIAYATSIKTQAPQSKVLGFVSYGYAGFTSLQHAPDAAGRDFTDFFLDGMRAASTRLMDELDIHWYPEARGGGGGAHSGAALIVGSDVRRDELDHRVEWEHRAAADSGDEGEDRSALPGHGARVH